MIKDKNSKIVNQKKDENKGTKEHCREPQKTYGKTPNGTENGVSQKEDSDLIYEILSGQLSAVANEIIAEIELSEDD